MNHDLTGIEKLIARQEEHIKRIKILTRIDNEIYLREHPEIEFIIENFLIKLLEDQPINTLKYAGNHFTKTEFNVLYENRKGNLK